MSLINKYLKNVKQRRKSERINKLKNDFELQTVCKDKCFFCTSKYPINPMGLFNKLPEEMMFRIFCFVPLSDLARLSLASKSMRNKLVVFTHGPQINKKVLPQLNENTDATDEIRKEGVHKHFKDLGIYMKKSTCLFSTKERLKLVGTLLEKLKDTHTEIRFALGNDTAYSCYGTFLHTFIAGWEDDEKYKAYVAIKGASCLEDRFSQVLSSAPGSWPWFEKYIRVFCREIFLDKAADASEKGFWLTKILKPLPIVFQARILYILYGPTERNEDGLIDWNLMSTCPTYFGVADPDLEELSYAVKILEMCHTKDWSHDDLISVFDELTGMPTDWCLENVSKLLVLCGSNICCEVLGSKAVNGRIHELAFLLYYIAQVAVEQFVSSNGKAQQLEWFVQILKHIMSFTPNHKDKLAVIRALFNVWEETILGLSEDMREDSDGTNEENDQALSSSVHNLATLSRIVLKMLLEKEKN